MRYLSISVHHPSGHDKRREPDLQSTASMVIDRGLKTGKVDSIPLSEDGLVRVLVDAANALANLRRANA